MPVVEIPHAPGSSNAELGAHWSVRAHEADRWRNLFALYGHDAPRLTGVPVRVCVTFYQSDRRRRDAGNMAKHVLDGAVKLGLIRDDGPPWLVEETYRVRFDPARPRIVFEYEPAESPAWPLPNPKTRGSAGRPPRR